MKLMLEIREVENGYVIFEGGAPMMMHDDRKKFVAHSISALEKVVGERALRIRDMQNREYEKQGMEPVKKEDT